MSKPRIGLSGCSYFLNNGTQRAYLNHDYIYSVEEAGGIPLVLPIIQDVEAIRGMAQSIDGLLLTGGEDINPLYFGENPEPKLGEIHDERDQFELALSKEVRSLNKPIFGICRGLQIMAVALGGSLWQDLGNATENPIKHAQEAGRHVATHTVKFLEGSHLATILGPSTTVNSYHHQAVKEPGPTGIVVATAPDGIIEAVDWTQGGTLCVGVQWHPEGMTKTRPDMLALFEEFVRLSQK